MNSSQQIQPTLDLDSLLEIECNDAPQSAPCWLIDLEQIGAERVNRDGAAIAMLVGNKARHLSTMLELGYAVPEGFCITTAAFRQGYRPTPASHQQTRSANTKKLTPALRTSILEAFGQLQKRYPDSRFVVRSSAPEEDGHNASWAGLFHSSLNIDSADELLAAVERGFDSLHSDRARLFRNQQDRNEQVAQQPDRQQPPSTPPATATTKPDEPAMALIVQRQIEPTASGMVFTRNPLVHPGHSDHPQLCINAVRGLAESLADGETNGDHYWLDPDNRLLQHRLAPALTDQSVQPPVLNRAQMRQVAKAARQLEQQFGYPLDIEFALKNQQLWLLQARAIVTPSATLTREQPARLQHKVQASLTRPAQQYLKLEQRRLSQRLQQLQQQQQLRCGPGILSNSNIAELLPSPTPMSFAVFNQIFAGADGAIPNGRRALGYDTSADSTEALFELVAGQPYFHLEIDARTYQRRDGSSTGPDGDQQASLSRPLPIADYLNQIRADPQRANYPEFGLYQQFSHQPEPSADHSQAADLMRYQHSRRFHRNMSLHGNHYLHQYRSWVENYLDQQLQQQRSIDLDSFNAPQLIIQINRWLQHLRQFSCCHFVMAARLGFYFAESLRFELQQLLGDQSEHWVGRLLQALPGSRINQQSFDLQAVAEQQLELQHYLDRYGHLSSNELELSLPRYDEKPDTVEASIETLLKQDPQHCQAAQPRQMFERQQRQRKQQERQLSELLDRLKVSADKRQQIWSDVRLARRFLPLRETIKYYYAGEYALIRQALLQLSLRLRLGAGQIFYLQPNELPLCLKELPAMRGLIKQRQQQHQLTLEIARQQPLAPVIFGDRIELTRPCGNGHLDHREDAPVVSPQTHSSQAHNGQPMAPGFIRGKVRLIDPQCCDLHQLMACVDKDDIIVTRSANLGLAPLMRKVAGLIVEVGGLLAHSACQAREAGIPAMVLPNATRTLAEGTLVEFDGRTGLLYAG